MKILMLNNEFPPLGGGTGTVNYELFKQFEKYPDLKIDLITSGNKNDDRVEQFSENIQIYKVIINSRDIHHASNYELIKYTLKASIKAIQLQRKNKYDLSFAWSTVPAGFISFLLKLFFRLPYYIRVGGPDIPGFEERYKNLYRIISPVIKLIWKKSKLLIAKCKTEHEMIKAINPNLNIHIIYNGIDTEKFFPTEKTLSTPLKIICSARLIKRKGQEVLIRAIAQLKEKGIVYRIDLIGEGDEKENYMQLADKLNVSEQICFCGYIKREKMPEFYQKADIFVLPSYNEGMSNALLEAMACGLPAVVTDVGGTEELVDMQNGFIFAKGNVAELSTVLEHIYHNKKELTNKSINSIKKTQKLSWEQIGRKYLKLLNNEKKQKTKKH
ncbi:MAG: glycosyltransferase family 4 protein [Bacteroidales bacterium]|nr:glycosyltransferase family 4 protein [Bacteroidales bacterium]